ncbi:MAG: hypothetical protein HY040_21200 [Planctomycetes bacterium]|nr:hypothetical protein [Planctomycetota bacterium]
MSPATEEQVLTLEESPPNSRDTFVDLIVIGDGETIHDMPAPHAVRANPRRGIQAPAVVIPLLPDCSPDLVRRRHAIAVDLSVEGMGLKLESPVDLLTQDVVVVLDKPGGGFVCTGLAVCDEPGETPDLHLGGRFGGAAHDLLDPKNLTPSFVASQLAYVLPQPAALLERWAELGVLERFTWDRVHVCPRCEGMPSFRRGCQACGSARVTQDRLIHHYACAHVGFAADFESGGELVCPKCRTRRLVVGADFEHLRGRQTCFDCHWSAPELDLVAQCLRCQLRFPCHQALELELVGYHAHRLDPLAFLASCGRAAPVRPGSAAN